MVSNTSACMEEGKEYAYNARGQQVGYSDNTLDATYAYNPSGLRSAKTVGGCTKYFIYNGMNIVFEYEDSALDGVTYYYGLNRTHNSEGEIYLYNAHGDVVQLVENGAVTVTYTYDAFGNLIEQTGESDNPFLYCGEYFDKETGTYYLRARYYNPANGRFTQQDAWAFMDTGDPLSLNLYTYCANNPVMYVDPSGKDAVLINKLVDNIASEINVEHMGAFFQDSDGNWWFFFWGDKVVYQQVDDASIFSNLDKMNEWLIDHDLVNENHPYRDSVYIKGDFTAAHNEALKLCENYEEGTFNKKYNLLLNNCTQVTMKLTCMGVLPSGITVGELLFRKRVDYGAIPNVNMNLMQKLFYNSATNLEDFEAAIEAQRKKYEAKNRFVRPIYMANIALVD